MPAFAAPLDCPCGEDATSSESGEGPEAGIGAIVSHDVAFDDPEPLLDLPREEGACSENGEGPDGQCAIVSQNIGFDDLSLPDESDCDEEVLESRSLSLFERIKI